MLTKIHELPMKRFDAIEDTDIMVIEDINDTYHIPIADLKYIFSNDKKIQAIYEELYGKISSIEDILSELGVNTTISINELKTQVELLTNAVNKNIGDLNVIKSHISALQNGTSELTNKYLDVDKRVNKLELDMSSAQDDISDHDSKITDHENKLSELETKSDTIREEFNTVLETVKQLDKTIESINSVSMDTINKLDEDLRKLIIEKYEELENIIDAHFHQTPIIV